MFSLLIAAGLAVASPVLHAQDGDGDGPRKERREGGPGERLEKLREHLGLSDEQVAKLKEVFAAEREELKAKRKELGKDAEREEVREAMKEIHQKYLPKIEAVLTPEQREKWAKMREKMKERREGGGPGPGAGGGEGKKRRGPDTDDEGMPPGPPEGGI